MYDWVCNHITLYSCCFNQTVISWRNFADATWQFAGRQYFEEVSHSHRLSADFVVRYIAIASCNLLFLGLELHFVHSYVPKQYSLAHFVVYDVALDIFSPNLITLVVIYFRFTYTVLRICYHAAFNAGKNVRVHSLLLCVLLYAVAYVSYSYISMHCTSCPCTTRAYHKYFVARCCLNCISHWDLQYIF